ncbi:MAG: ResA-like WAxxUGC motif-containing protein, partial [Ilumatobacteraceae bacterium]
REAHRLHPLNLTYKRQAWTLVTTAPGATENDLMQGPNEVYESNLLDDVLGHGGFGAFIVRPEL